MRAQRIKTGFYRLRVMLARRAPDEVAAWLSSLLAIWLAPFLTAQAYRGNIGLVPVFNVFQLVHQSYVENSLAPSMLSASASPSWAQQCLFGSTSTRERHSAEPGRT